MRDDTLVTAGAICAATILWARKSVKVVSRNDFFWSGLDYAQMKLFTVSILWRMSLSSHDLIPRFIWVRNMKTECGKCSSLKIPWNLGVMDAPSAS